MTVIRPASRLPRLDVGELWHYRELLWTLVWRDVAVRYKQTFLGIAWAILVPAFTALVYVIVFGKFANFPAGSTPYPSLVVAGVLPMQYFASALSLASLSLLVEPPARDEGVLPPHAAPARRRVPCRSSTSSSGCPCCSSSSGSTTRGRRGWKILTAPLFILLAVVTVLGIGLLLAAVNVRYRDVRYMIPVFLQVLPLLSGVMFAVDQIPVKWQWILAFNPMTVGDRGLALGGPRREPARLGQIAVGVAVALRAVRRRAREFRSSEPRSRTRSDGRRDRGRGALEAVPPRRVPGRLRDAARDARPRREAAHRPRAPRPARRSGRSRTSRSRCPRARSSASSDATAPGSRRS